jgi:polysaccharide export outer membrane protein
MMVALALTGCENYATLPPLNDAERDALIKSAQTTSPFLKPGERIKITVFGEDRLSGDYEIDPAGFVSLPLAGTIKAAGLSKQQMEAELARKFRNEYLRDPKVTVDVSSFRPIYVYGEVGHAGEFPFRSGLNVISALALAGGTTYRASRNNVLIQHLGESGFREYPLNSTIPILPGDIVRVPERYF